MRQTIQWRGPGWYAQCQEHNSNRESFINSYQVSDTRECRNPKDIAYRMGLGTPFWLKRPPENMEVEIVG